MEFVPLGEQEMEVLAFITEQAPVTASQVAEAWGEERALARTTVLTMMERLRRKGYLMRQRRQGVFQYSPRVSRSELLQGLLHRFVETTLGGSLAPVVAYLSNNRQLSPAELDELRQLVDALKAAEGTPVAGEEGADA
ncbi:MAG: methicillin resistance protein [Armatimonadetes bacterium]|jgi:predicted transcriptional regulator|nr:methicillin resistance protein [Armatimonadota bacterium]